MPVEGSQRRRGGRTAITKKSRTRIVQEQSRRVTCKHNASCRDQQHGVVMAKYNRALKSVTRTLIKGDQKQASERRGCSWLTFATPSV